MKRLRTSRFPQLSGKAREFSGLLAESTLELLISGFQLSKRKNGE